MAYLNRAIQSTLATNITLLQHWGLCVAPVQRIQYHFSRASSELIPSPSPVRLNEQQRGLLCHVSLFHRSMEHRWWWSVAGVNPIDLLAVSGRKATHKIIHHGLEEVAFLWTVWHPPFPVGCKRGKYQQKKSITDLHKQCYVVLGLGNMENNNYQEIHWDFSQYRYITISACASFWAVWTCGMVSKLKLHFNWDSQIIQKSNC